MIICVVKVQNSCIMISINIASLKYPNHRLHYLQSLRAIVDEPPDAPTRNLSMTPIPSIDKVRPDSLYYIYFYNMLYVIYYILYIIYYIL